MPFAGRRYNAHGIGVRTMATWGTGSAVQVYSCPTQCTMGVGPRRRGRWCGASAAVAFAATIGGVSVTVAVPRFRIVQRWPSL
jgi:hypothetical protein